MWWPAAFGYWGKTGKGAPSSVCVLALPGLCLIIACLSERCGLTALARGGGQCVSYHATRRAICLSLESTCLFISQLCALTRLSAVSGPAPNIVLPGVRQRIRMRVRRTGNQGFTGRCE
jgi:hypothetical protein